MLRRMRREAETGAGATRVAPAFSPRELDCLARLVLGLTDHEIAHELAITHATVRFHLHGARSKLGATSRTHLAALAVALGVVSPSPGGARP